MENIEKRFRAARTAVLAQEPLIHCITNPISINDCANAVLALGGRPIMAEHPAEVCGITARSKALAVNLGNITDARAQSIILSGKTASQAGIASVIDVVGTACSPFRMTLAQEYIAGCRPAVIKGNVSEIKAVAGEKNDAAGIDVGAADAVTRNNRASLTAAMAVVKAYAKTTGAVVLASGEIDFISDGNQVFCVENGTRALTRVTGTGCMQNVIIGTFLSVTDALTAALLAAAVLGVCGEIADDGSGTGTFRTGLMDALSLLTDRQLEEKMKITRYPEQG